MSRHQYLAAALWLLWPAESVHAVDVQEIVRLATETLRADWAADEDYAYIETAETHRGETVTTKTSQVIYIEGSDYYMSLAPGSEQQELLKLKDEVRRRKEETPAARRKRIDAYTKQRDENAALILDFPNAFDFELLREETLNGHAALVFAGTPRKRSGPLSNAAKVLAGMRGTVWLDKEGYHALRVECSVISPVPIYGVLARVLPGTRIEFGMEPVTDSVWLIDRLAMTLTVSKLFLFRSTQITNTTYSGYRLNELVLKELLAKAGE